MKLLLAGPPRCGKEMLLRNLAEAFRGTAGGTLVTDLLGADGRRCGFELQAVWREPGAPWQVLERVVLAHSDREFELRFGRYWVNPAALELAVRAIDGTMHESGLVLVDEIGPMQILSTDFQHAILRCLDSNLSLLATVSAAASPFLNEVRRRAGVHVVEVTEQNRRPLEAGLAAWLR